MTRPDERPEETFDLDKFEMTLERAQTTMRGLLLMNSKLIAERNSLLAEREAMKALIEEQAEEVWQQTCRADLLAEQGEAMKAAAVSLAAWCRMDLASGAWGDPSNNRRSSYERLAALLPDAGLPALASLDEPLPTDEETFESMRAMAEDEPRCPTCGRPADEREPFPNNVPGTYSCPNPFHAAEPREGGAMSANEQVVTPCHPVASGAGYDCSCGECLYRRGLAAEPPKEES
jgi:hypothetical protein